jgi:hypothetical protein
MATMFFVVDVRGRYDLLLAWDWIHMNGCVPYMLHQCLIQWVGDEVHVLKAEEAVSVATTEAQSGCQDGNAACLSGRNLSNYDYISMSRDDIIPINVRPTSMTWLKNVSGQ